MDDFGYEQEYIWEQDSYIIEQNEADDYRYELDDYEYDDEYDDVMELEDFVGEYD